MHLNKHLQQAVVQLLKQLIATPSFSKEETGTANLIASFLEKRQVPFERSGNNIWAKNRYQNNGPTILLNSHHDTVRPAAGWQRDPFQPIAEDGKLYGLGSNDAGASLVSLLAVFLHFYEMDNLPFNLIFLASAEEEISGQNGVASVLPKLGNIAFGVVGEPTQMQMAVAEKGLMVVDAEAKGKAGHAARNEGVNAIYIALTDISFLKNFAFEKTSNLLGPVKMSITQITAGTQHNVVPDSCQFVIDIRTNELYSNEEVFSVLQEKTASHLTARSFRLNSSRIGLDHPLVKSGEKIGLSHYGSPTLSDQALMNFPTLKIGPGDSARSHTADEFIYLEEIENGMAIYVELLMGMDLTNFGNK